jgi:hypothetical protein
MSLTLLEVSAWNWRKPIFESGFVKPAGRNPFGEVAPGGKIVVEGHLRSATVQYVRTRPWWSGQDQAGEHDPLKYEIHFGLDLPLLPDYVLSEEGPHHAPDGTAVRMLLVHPDVCLVLMSSESAPGDPPTYRRIGIVRQPAAFAEIYTGAVDWMAGSAKERIAII